MGLNVTGMTRREIEGLVRNEHEREVLLAALNAYGSACIAAVRAMSLAGDESKRLEFAARYDHARAIAERAAGLA